MVYLEREFWHDHILTRIPPPYTEDGSLILESLRRRLGAADKTIPAIQLDNDLLPCCGISAYRSKSSKWKRRQKRWTQKCSG